ncbi:MAG: mannitol/fructose-specific phosphotransferase system IIA component (Ntr-type) [Verrucomicrobiales bacterium]|jgi:mannitol/fructose-specific phosphotransferase system IIA component (Ntr-type)
MNLASLLTVKQIVSEMKATERWPAIVELVEHLEKQQILSGDDREAILEALHLREDQTSTGIGSGVAIPHAFSNKLDQVIAVFGRSGEGIDFEAIDNAPVRFIVLFMVPEDQYHTHLRTLAAIAKTLTNGQTREKLGQAKDSAAILKILQAKSPRA